MRTNMCPRWEQISKKLSVHNYFKDTNFAVCYFGYDFINRIMIHYWLFCFVHFCNSLFWYGAANYLSKEVLQTALLYHHCIFSLPARTDVTASVSYESAVLCTATTPWGSDDGISYRFVQYDIYLWRVDVVYMPAETVESLLCDS